MWLTLVSNAGFSTGNFDLAGNLEEGGEARQGLDEEGLLEVRRIMEINRVGFDEARRIRQARIFKQNGKSIESRKQTGPLEGVRVSEARCWRPGTGRTQPGRLEDPSRARLTAVIVDRRR